MTTLLSKRIINVPARGIGKKAVETLEMQALEEKCSIFDLVKRVVNENIPRLSTKLRPVVEIFQHLQLCQNKKTLSELLAELIKVIDYKTYIEKKVSAANSR